MARTRAFRVIDAVLMMSIQLKSVSFRSKSACRLVERRRENIPRGLGTRLSMRWLKCYRQRCRFGD